MVTVQISHSSWTFEKLQCFYILTATFWGSLCVRCCTGSFLYINSLGSHTCILWPSAQTGESKAQVLSAAVSVSVSPPDHPHPSFPHLFPSIPLAQRQDSFLTTVLPGLFAISAPLTLFPLASASWTHAPLPPCASLAVYILITALRLASASQLLWPRVHSLILPEVWFPYLGQEQEKKA
jgi:hypothetical protein